MLSIVFQFYKTLKDELINGNPFLAPDEQTTFKAHRPLIANPRHYSPELVATNYVNRRLAAVKSVLDSNHSNVFDAGCGYGSDSFLFASLGARVLGVDSSAENISIAKKRKEYYEQALGKTLDVTFLVADLDEFVFGGRDLSLTWISSVLAAIRDQDRFLMKINRATRAGGKIVITDFNLMHPPFLLGEWHRRRMAIQRSTEFAKAANFLDMLQRRARNGARYFPLQEGGVFDDVQFFTPRTLSDLLKKTGFRPLSRNFSGFIPPLKVGNAPVILENFCSRLPGLRQLGRAYVVTGVK